MLTTLDEIADGIYRISTFVPEVGPDGFTFNQFLVDAEEPLLYHTGMKGLFPLVSREVARVRPLEQLRWIAFAHVEADECGAIEQFLAAAPNAQVAHGATGCMVSLNDMLSSPPRPLVDGETVDLGGKEVTTPPGPPSRHAARAPQLGVAGPVRGDHGHAAVRRPVFPGRQSAGRHLRQPGRRGDRGRAHLPCDLARASRTGHAAPTRGAAARHTGDHARRVVPRRRWRCPAGSC
jgi:hypothetical protein